MEYTNKCVSSAIYKNKSRISSETRGHQKGDSRGDCGGRRIKKCIRQNLGHPHSHKDAKVHPCFRTVSKHIEIKIKLICLLKIADGQHVVTTW